MRDVVDAERPGVCYDLPLEPPGTFGSRGSDAGPPDRRGATMPKDKRLEDVSPIERDLLDRVNQARSAKRRRRLTVHPALMAAAAAHSADMAAHCLCQHEGSDGSTVEDRLRGKGYAPASCAENIACGARSTVQVFEMWMASPAHRANVLERSFHHFGVGIATGRGDLTPVWTLVLGTDGS